MKAIRKVSIGADYKNAMHYVVGNTVIDRTYTIETIRYEGENIGIWIVNENNEQFLWKEFTPTMPISIEFNIEF